MDTEFGSNDMSEITVDAISYSWVVDSAIRSSTSSELGASRVHSFSSIVDCAIRSDTASNFGTSPAHNFVSAENVRSTVASRSSNLEVMSNVTRHDVAARWFTRAELVAATNNFSLDRKISAKRFGVVYRGKLVDGREVAIKKDGTWSNRHSPKFHSELTFLSCLHHKHLVGLVGFCEDNSDERFLAYEYMKNGWLYNHLHDKGSSVLNFWKMRIKIALDASLGLEYLHSNYEGGSIIHGNVKSCNILFDATWTARVTDFGLTFMKKTAETVGYIDPEYFPVLTAKSDVYGYGVVLLELLTGKKPMFKSSEGGRGPSLSVANFAVPAILAGDLVEILDPKVGPPNVHEAEALELVANTALNCVNLERKYRPTMTNIVVNLKQALAICDRGNPQYLSPFWGVQGWKGVRTESVMLCESLSRVVGVNFFSIMLVLFLMVFFFLPVCIAIYAFVAIGSVCIFLLYSFSVHSVT